MSLFDLSAKITLDTKGYEQGIDKAKDKTSKFKDQLGNGLKKAGKVGLKALTVASAGVTALVTTSTKSFAEYEQLVGGVDTLFKNSSQKLQGYANVAYKTAGMSANDYMENVTSFSASLLQSLGGDTDKTAEYANRAMIDMSDNANKMGTSIDNIVMTYQSLSRGNFAMLDNLKLGYGGTKKELERLLADAEKLSGKKFDMSNFADVTEAIHIIQDEMGITGTTALEASTTIEGSLNSTKSAWQNLLTTMATDDIEFFEQAMQEFVDSASNLFNNLLPVFDKALMGISNLIEQVFPVIMEQMPNFINEFLPELTLSAFFIIQSLVQGLSDNADMVANGTISLMLMVIENVIDMLPEILTAGVKIVGALAIGLLQALPDLVAQIPTLIDGLYDEFMAHKDEYKQIGINLLTELWNGLKESWSNLSSWFTNKWNNLFNKKATVSIGTSDADGSHAGGLSYVPYDGYTARLHKGERILTAEENKGFGAGATIIQNIYAQKQTASDLEQNAMYQARKVALLGV